AVDNATGTLKLRLEVPNPDQLLRANQFARVRVTTQNLKDALLVPQRAVQEFQGKNYVWVIDAESKAQQRDVTMGARVDSNWIVTKGLSAGEVLVVEGMQKLKPGIAVSTRDADAAPAPAVAAPTPAAKP
ncbi:MAG: efflux RND transporter periplasmic adaptor subunit, partial [Nevskia sp.]|uniref:efflux RND transporter periplasmic adaptor subunit n=1 Tax=Nevskia sp. TaxID=1929292 RepID=UPI0040370E13